MAGGIGDTTYYAQTTTAPVSEWRLTVDPYNPPQTTYYCTWPYYTNAPLTESDVRRVIREEIEDLLTDPKAVKKTTIAALKKRLREFESD